MTPQEWHAVIKESKKIPSKHISFEKATPQQKRKMKKEIKLLESLKPHYSEDETEIKVIRGSRLNEIARIEQKNHVIPIHRGKKDFIPIVWLESFEYHYELMKTMYEPTYLKFG